MELPIDHFRLLGVSPSSDTEEVLRFFHLRLDRAPQDGFTPEVIAQRAELLRRSADLLCNKQLRENYETALLGGASGLEFSSNREVAGLILLWEADISYEAFKLARKALRPPQAPALGSGRESDLTLLAALACRDAALHEQEQRHYSSSAELLEEGIQLLQRMGKLPENRQNLEKELEALLPYRILDLLSRDLSDQNSHQEGLNLLDSFVLKRGGLEGKKLSRLGDELNQSDFEIFFQQIRKFLTVQEQIDLYSHWYKNGSPDAGFLCAISLVASGFYRRKPAQLQKAKRRINKLNLQGGFDSMPLLGCIDLLLADVQQAEECFRNSPDQGLKEWLDKYPGERLAALCDYSRNWLLRDVLPGFRDIDVDSVDLEAWFADRDVQDYVDKIEKRGALGIARAGLSLISGMSPEKYQSNESLDSKQSESNFDSVADDLDDSPLNDVLLRKENVRRFTFAQNLFENYKYIISSLLRPDLNFSMIKLALKSNRLFLGTFVFILLFVSGGLISLVSMRTLVPDSTVLGTSKIKNDSSEKIIDDEVSSEGKQSQDLKVPLTFSPLTASKPSEEQILRLIKVWLQSKADILLGKESNALNKVAREPLVKIVNQQRLKDISLKEKQIITTKVESLEIEDQTSKRIAVKARISYRDQRVKESGDVVSETSIPSLTVKYILGRKKGQWKLLDFYSGN
ncbi:MULTISPECIES: ARC6/PARC6 family protein [Prochlorococcus]|uniref:Cell division protein Ftn2 n=1 Tax=Prochlorococcus marinus (strain SARG / CCMP1375 / SS120) TaxID=167539 RepID=Q7VAU3_PROMA|nr:MULTISPECIES: ARC6/PARC6 family protein [Prochlorococcus]AAQ00405.1 Cell division protein Ftn2 [Prochlorococcus marinus subsp. marinus str. CCMP1375]KGG14286.1 Cell division protein ZipN/Ftn2/Arc6 [Prochlorococcus marinus str. LG]KGG22141.1 Cell division protein ZipN/Ftn2/Arc6 [Prochlorococcus marinus str. SS2]KGG24541.1 Cell division protein ZipN/Ftn2/Arc6 [Prochlorococcus marinus str. SS35]KGG33436.1 Cell division protein ZipN/Ftn2/Arc6 [Prochlorococcus marinus str. SS51]